MPDSFDIDFKLLPPKLQMQLWVLALDANTSKVNLAYKAGAFTTSLAYNYGGNVQAGLSLRNGPSGTVGVNPGSGDTSVGLVYRGFNFGATAGFSTGAYGVGLGYGASLLPFPAELASTFNSAGEGLPSMVKDIGKAPDNPLAWYGLHSNDVTALTTAVSLGQKIAEAGDKKDIFGAALRLKYDSNTGAFTIYGAAQWKF